MNKHKQRAAALELLTSIDTTLAALAENQGITPIYHDPTPGDYGTDQCPRAVNADPVGHVPADMPQEHAVPSSFGTRRADPGTCEGSAEKAPQNAVERAAMGEVGEDPDDYEPYDVFQPALNRARHATTVPEVAFPTGPDGSLWWVRGIESDQPVEGLATLEIGGRAASLNTIDARYEICRGVDTLTEATRVVAVPLRLLESLYDASALNPEAVLDRIHDIEQWSVEYGQTGE